MNALHRFFTEEIPADEIVKVTQQANAELNTMLARIDKLETAASNAVAWLHHYPSPDNIEEQAENNRRRAVKILEKALTK